jgi:small subunit ribosomal protein S21
MIIVNVERGKNIDTALRTYKNKIQRTKLIQELKSRKEFVKPSVTKRKVKLKAIYVSKLKASL